VKTRVLIVGGGFAGAATAAALSRRASSRITLIEAEKTPGVHSSGRNASMARRVIEDPVLTRLAVESVDAIKRLESESELSLFLPSGGLLLGSSKQIEALFEKASTHEVLQRDMQRLTSKEVVSRVDALRGSTMEEGIATSGCGVVDIHALLSHYLYLARSANVQVLTSHSLQGIEVRANAVKRARINGQWMDFDVIVNAAGFGANAVASMAGLPPLPLKPSRRHLFVTSRWERVDETWPFVWDITNGLYFRPESGGLLMCACDQTPWERSEVPVEPQMRVQLAEKFSLHVPELARARPAHSWAGLRVLTPDGRFIVGADPRVSGFIWVAGLGGHGMTTSAAVGELAAKSVLDEQLPTLFDRAFSPKRFLESTDESFAA
jgi:D-arginine dehydrogenase